MKSTSALFLVAAIGSLFISMAPSFLVVSRPLLTKNELTEAYRRLSFYGNR